MTVQGGCVPLDVGILTDRGWLSCREVRVGDRTLGFDPNTGMTSWTTVRRVDFFETAEIVEVRSRAWRVRTSAQHRWLTLDPETGSRRWSTTAERDDQWTIAAPMCDGPGLPISTGEAELVGWLLTDGGQHDGHHHRGVNFSVHVWQTKSAGVQRLDELLQGRASWNGKGFRIRNAYARDLMRRVGLTHIKNSAELIAAATLMTKAQRDAMLIGVIGGDGIASGKKILQNDGPTLVAIATLVALCGSRVTVTRRSAFYDGMHRNGVPMTIYVSSPLITTRVRPRVAVGPGPAWCPVTDAGTWTARFGQNPVLTGS